jgi:release factor glutamine methyltransferase
MNQVKPTAGSVLQYFRNNLNAYYPERELEAIMTIILCYISGKNRSFVLAHPDHEISSFNWFKVKKICADLKNMVPVQYVTGESEFYGIKLEVNENTMIPRQETEELVDLVIKENRKTNLKILDIGTGTGCIAICLALKMQGVDVTATDNSSAALLVATRNAERNDASINFINDDILNPDIHKYSRYDIVVCNPPYITESEKISMNRNVLDYEPHNALFVPDNDALIYYRSVLEICTQALISGGHLYFEINENKAKEMENLLTEYGYLETGIINDINGKARITKSIKP